MNRLKRNKIIVAGLLCLVCLCAAIFFLYRRPAIEISANQQFSSFKIAELECVIRNRRITPLTIRKPLLGYNLMFEVFNGVGEEVPYSGGIDAVEFSEDQLVVIQPFDVYKFQAELFEYNRGMKYYPPNKNISEKLKRQYKEQFKKDLFARNFNINEPGIYKIKATYFHDLKHHRVKRYWGGTIVSKLSAVEFKEPK